MSAPTYTSSGTKSASGTTLPKDVFNVEVKSHELVRQAYDTYLANGRVNLAVTKTRGLVRGGGKKPWKQKGTGRARFGSTRNPIWRGGGIAFGPTGAENYSKQMNIKARRLALKQALTLASDKVLVIEDIKLKTAKTSDFNKLLSKLSIAGNTLIVVDAISNELSLSSRNIAEVKVVKASSLNVYDTLNADHIVFSKTALKALQERLGN